jgi:signal transduction histidine kinase
MTDSKPSKIQHLQKKTAFKVVLVYAVFATLWIYFSDLKLAMLIKDPEVLTRAQTVKGAFYVLVTAGLFYLYLSRCLHSLGDRERVVQTELEERFSQLDTLFNSMNAIVYVSDLNSHQLLYVNEYAIKIFGPDWQGRTCHAYLQSKHEGPCGFCTNKQLIINGVPGDAVVWEFFNLNNHRWYECFDKAITWTDGRLVRLEIALDITERKEIERTKDEILSSISHEMRTPLTAISGFAELLINETNIPAEHQKHIETIYREALKLTELINSFLDIRRLKSDRSRIDYERQQVRHLIDKALDKDPFRAERHDILIDCDSALSVYGNAKELTQVISQLVNNACLYSPEGASVFITAFEQAGMINISFTDQGAGVPAYELKAIFEPFHRLDRSDTRSTSGVGLGLYVSKEIISMHGGEIRVESVLGKGSTFTVTLPKPTAEQRLELNNVHIKP